jgi:hypothetical protein
MESNFLKITSFFMALNRPGGTMYVCHYSLHIVPQSILYFTLFHIIYITLIASMVFCSKCPSNTVSNNFLPLGISILFQMSFSL